jgi:hypothetical protein
MADTSFDHSKSWSENLETHQHYHEGKAQRAGDKLNKLRGRRNASPELDELRDSDIKKLENEYQSHIQHAAAAKKGYVLDDQDPSWQLTHQSIRAESGRRGRLLHWDETSAHDDGQSSGPLRVKKA